MLASSQASSSSSSNSACKTMVESALSPPYDGSEFDSELFPELGSVAPEEMVDIESLADQALDSVCSSSCSLPVCETPPSPEIVDLDSHSDSELASVLSMEEEEETGDNLLRYLISEVGGEQDKTSRRARVGRKRRLSSHDSGNFSENAKSPCAQNRPKVQRRKVKPPKTTVTVVDDGVKRTVQGPNRNAVMAKLNRERKKQLMSDLEKKVGLLGTENDALKKQNVCLRKKLGNLERELQYVKGVLANQSALAGLLKNIQATELEFHSSMNAASSKSRMRKEGDARSTRRRVDDHDYCLEQPDSEYANERQQNYQRDENVILAKSEIAGVCLHVTDGSVSLEFCSKCSMRAKAATGRQEYRAAEEPGWDASFK